MKKLVATTLFILGVYAAPAMAEVNAAQAQKFVEDVTNDGIENIINRRRKRDESTMLWI